MNTAAILSVGTELTDGMIQDNHGKYISAALKQRGVKTLYAVLVPDNHKIISGELLRLAGLVDLLIVTGGLGPTADDLTRSAVAEVSDSDLIFQKDIWEAIKSRYGNKISECNRKQAYIPAGFDVLTNRLGSAPGFLGRIRKAVVACLPGPPRELEPMFVEYVLPVIQAGVDNLSEQELVGSVFMLPEAKLEEYLQQLQTGSITWGTRACEDRIILILRDGNAASRESLFEELSERVGKTYIRRGDLGPLHLLYNLLKQKKLTIAVAESCTGGLFSKMMTDIPGSSEVYRGGCVTYSNASKVRLLGVNPEAITANGAVSDKVARAMAHGAAEILSADYGIGLTGIAGPAGGTEVKPVGIVWVAVEDRSGKSGGGGKCYSGCFNFNGARHLIRKKAVIAASLMTEQLILNPDKLDIVLNW